MSFSSFLVAVLGFLYNIMSSANSVTFTSYFPIWIPFISFTSLIPIARISKTMLNNSGKNGHPCLIPDLRGNAFSFSPLRIMFTVGLSYMALLGSFCAHFLKSFNHKWVLNFVKGFFCIYWDYHMNSHNFYLNFINEETDTSLHNS